MSDLTWTGTDCPYQITYEPQFPPQGLVTIRGPHEGRAVSFAVGPAFARHMQATLNEVYAAGRADGRKEIAEGPTTEARVSPELEQELGDIANEINT
jgi:hypothetical protein